MTTGKTGRPRRTLTNEETGEIVRLVRSGFGLAMATEQVGVDYKVFLKERTRLPRFALQIKTAVLYRRERLVALRYAQALAGDPHALDFLIGRDDKARMFALQRKDARAAAKQAAGDDRPRITRVEIVHPSCPIDARLAEALEASKER